MLSPNEVAAVERGATLKRYIRSAAAMQGIYDDASLGDRVKVHRRTVAGWWLGAKPSPETLRGLAEVTGLSVSELGAFVYYDGPPPRLPDPVEREEGETRGAAAERALRGDAGTGSRATPPAPRETKGSGR